MFRFASWCLLCASKNAVEINIQSLDETLRESIGQFSIINFTLTDFPSSICKKCHDFLKELEARKERYSKAEQMFLELLKTRNKAVDIECVRTKYQIHDDEIEMEQAVISNDQYFEIAEQEQDNDDKTSPESAPKADDLSKPMSIVSIETVEHNHRTRSNKLSSPKQRPKLLNPTTKVIRNLSRLDLFSCDLCLHRGSTKLSIERHMQKIHIEGKCSKTSFQCETCFKTFSKKTILQSHELIHRIDRPTFECQHCGKILSSPTAVSNHIKWMHSNRKDYKCSTCAKVFSTKGSLTEHQKIHSDYKGHVCAICKKSYKTASILVQHLDTHSETEYHCPECGMRLNSKRTLRQHMLKHSDVVRHTCTICSVQFKRTKAYKEHLISLHTELKAYSCDWCEKTFANGANCRKHKKEAHPKEVAEADEKKTNKQVRLPKIDELLSMSLKKTLVDV